MAYVGTDPNKNTSTPANRAGTLVWVIHLPEQKFQLATPRKQGEDIYEPGDLERARQVCDLLYKDIYECFRHCAPRIALTAPPWHLMHTVGDQLDGFHKLFLFLPPEVSNMYYKPLITHMQAQWTQLR